MRDIIIQDFLQQGGHPCFHQQGEKPSPQIPFRDFSSWSLLGSNNGISQGLGRKKNSHEWFKWRDLNEITTHKSIRGMKAWNGGHETVKGYQQKEDFAAWRTKQARKEAVLWGPCGIWCSWGVRLRRRSPRHGLPEKRCWRVEEAGERCPLPSSCPPWYPPLAKPTEANARRVDSQAVGVTAGKGDRREQGGVELSIPFISVFFLPFRDYPCRIGLHVC